MAFHPADSETVKEGPVAVKKAGLISSWRGWSDKWIVLKARSLVVYKNRFAPEAAVQISLNSITRIERTHSSRKGYCLLLETRGTRLLFAFRSDEELYNWHDKIYAFSPLMLFKAENAEMEFDLENSIIRGYSSSGDSPDLSSRPSTPHTLPGTKMPVDDDSMPPPPPAYTHSPAPSRQFLLDLEDLRGQQAPPVQPVAVRTSVIFSTQSEPFPLVIQQRFAPGRAQSHPGGCLADVQPDGATPSTEE
ncbi:hypothetical protein B0H16DRAFT_634588 [Mycena metata]|uniref:PH domain-containing protein n=1 Tax=Mycena metata TaxID=1033252 RepID=A0AAD7J8H4_9AGAR|nr:hypothetical protein B0H16DRAFT_634588 [Mycena metata]